MDVTRAPQASGQPADAAASGGWTWNDVMVAILNVWRHIKTRTLSIDVKFHADPIWNGGALGFFWRASPHQEQQEEEEEQDE